MSVRYLSAMGPRCCEWIVAILAGSGALLFFVSLIASFTVLHLNILRSFSSFLIFLRLLLFCLSFFSWCGVCCWLNLLAHFLGSWWVVVFLASKYMALCGWFIVTWWKSFHYAPELRAVTSVSECLYKLNSLFALMTLNIFLFRGLFALFWGPLDLFFEFYLFSESFTASLGKFATTFLILCGICLPAAACVYGFP